MRSLLWLLLISLAAGCSRPEPPVPVGQRLAPEELPGPPGVNPQPFPADFARFGQERADTPAEPPAAPVGEPRPAGPRLQPDETGTGHAYANLRAILAPDTPKRRCVAWSPDGATIAASRGRAQIELWDARTGTLKLTIATGLTSWDLTGLAYSYDGQRLASCESGNVSVWDACTGQRIWGMNCADSCRAIAFTPDGQMLLSLHATSLSFWTADAGRKLGSLDKLENQYAESLALSPDGKTVLLAGAKDKTLVVVDVPSRAVRKRLAGHQREVYVAAFAPDGRSFASADNEELILWDATTQKPRARAKHNRNNAKGLVYSPGGTLLLVGGGSFLQFCSPVTGQTISTMSSEMGDDGVFSPDGRALASVSPSQRSLNVLDIEHARPATVGVIPPAPEAAVALPDDRLALLGERGRPLQVVDVAGKALWSGPERQRWDGLAGSFDGKFLAVWDENTLAVFAGATGKQIATRDLPQKVTAAAFAPNGKMIAVGGPTSVRLFHSDQLKPIRTLPVTDTIHILTFSRDGQWLAGYDEGGFVHTWEAATGKKRASWMAHDGQTLWFGFGTGSTLVTLTSTGWDWANRQHSEFAVWEATTGKELLRRDLGWLQGAGLAVLPSGTEIAVLQMMADHTTRMRLSVWSLTDGRQLTEHYPVGRNARLRLNPAGDRVALVACPPTSNYGNVDHPEFKRGEWWTVAEVTRPTRMVRTDLLSQLSRPTWQPPQLALVPEVGSLPSERHASFSLHCPICRSANGQRAAVVINDKAVWVWDVTAGKRIQVFESSEGQLIAAALSPDGRKVAAVQKIGFDQSTVQVWDTTTGAQLQRWPQNGHCLATLVWGSDTLLVGGWKDALTVWDTSTGKELRRLNGHAHLNGCLEVMPKAQHLLGWTADFRLGRFALDGSQPVWQVKNHDDLRMVAVAPDEQLFACVSYAHTTSDYSVSVYQTADGTLVSRINSVATSLNQIGFTADSRELMIKAQLRDTAGDTLLRVDCATGRVVSRLDGNGTIGWDFHLLGTDRVVSLIVDDKVHKLALYRLDEWRDAALQKAALPLLRADAEIVPVDDRWRVRLRVQGRTATAALAHLAGLGRPLELDLHESSALTDAAFAHLAATPQIAALKLSKCRGSLAGLAQLAQIKGLKRLDLTGTPVSQSAAQLRTLLPGVEIVGP